ncbi:MAG: ANTAR domain-containing protein [Clostridiales bacterium]|nr:ANTAR domain-containing protein [Clostridiales bacterium]
MENVMIVSSSDKGVLYISEMLNSALVCIITAVRSGSEARRMLLERDFDLVIINAPLRDETGESLALHVASKEFTQVILLVKREFFEVMSAVCENEGILTISKPVNKYIFMSALSLARSAYNKLRKVHHENDQLRKKIEDIRIVDRAKCILISLFNMSEKEAHRYIEKQAMDMRITKRAVAERIIKTYENF